MQFAFTGFEGHWLHGSGTTTVTHNRNIGTYNGALGYMVFHCADTACAITALGTNSFVVAAAGNWQVVMVERTPRQSG